MLTVAVFLREETPITTKTRILIIDDHQLFADGLGLILQGLDRPVDIAISFDAYEALSQPRQLVSNNLVLVDLHIPQFSGFAFLTAARMQRLCVDIAVVSGTEKKEDIERAIQLGAKGFIPKDSDSREMLRAVSRLLDGNRYLPDHWEGKIDWLAARNDPPVKSGSLTNRQLQVLNLMKDGMQNKQIAAILGISVSSVKGHIEQLFRHLNVNNRTACVQAARDARLII